MKKFTTGVLLLALALSSVSCGRAGSESTAEGGTSVIKIACVGDSITEGYNGADYPSLLQKKLGEGYRVENYGAGGSAAMHSASYPYTSTRQYRKSLDSGADIFIIMFGTNDTNRNNWKGAEQFKKEYTELLDAYLSLPQKPKVYIATVIDAYNAEGGTSGTMAYGIQGQHVEEINRTVRSISEERNISLIDVNAATKKHTKMYNADRIHPNAGGAEAIAETVADAVPEPEGMARPTPDRKQTIKLWRDDNIPAWDGPRNDTEDADFVPDMEFYPAEGKIKGAVMSAVTQRNTESKKRISQWSDFQPEAY